MRALVNGFELAYRLEGPESSPVVTLCHSLGADSGMWDEQMPALGGRRVLRIDMRGHGQSQAPSGPYTLEDLAADVVALWDSLDIAHSDFIGLSIGGMVGQALGIHHGSRLASLMLCDTRCSSGSGQAQIWDERIAMVRAAGSLEPVVDSTIPRWFSEGFIDRAPERIAQVRDMLRRCSVEGYAGCGRAISTFDFSPQLGAIDVRTLVVVGSDDQSTRVTDAEALVRAIAGSQLRVIDGCRHLPNIQAPKAFNEIMSSWLQ